MVQPEPICTVCHHPYTTPHAHVTPAPVVPTDVSRILLRALVWCGDQITPAQRETAWAWVETNSPQVEEMGG